MNDKCVIIVFVKHPQPGRVKTRLARVLGDEAAVRIYRNLVEHLVGMLRQVGVDEVRVCFDPKEKQSEIDCWLRPVWLAAGGEVLSGEPALVFCPQCEGDLGARMKSAFDEVFRDYENDGSPAPKVVVIGSDCIEIDGETFQASWGALNDKDVVFGPTKDGGYYLLGMKSSCPGLFENVPWSTEKTLEVSLERAKETGLAMAMLDVKHDIDTEEDWRRFEKMFPLGSTSEREAE